MCAAKAQLNYDPIAESYNRRYVENRLPGVEAALQTFVTELNASRVLEVGCGTGRWLQGLLGYGANLFGLDFSRGMLRQARATSREFQLAHGRAEQLPYTPGSFELIYCVNALHHFSWPQAFIEQAWQILAPGGVLVIIGQVPQDRRNRWYVYDYFTGTYQRDIERFPSWGQVLEWCIPLGFELITWHPVQWIHDSKQGTAVLEDPFLEKNATSQLALLSEAEYQAGLERIQAALQTAKVKGENLNFVCDLRLDLLVAQKPGSRS